VRTIWKAVGLLIAGLAMTGCAQLDATAGVEPPPAEGRLYPNLATVPRPPSVEPLAVRQAEVDRLMAARETTLRDDRELRAIDPGRALPPPSPRAAPRPSAPTGAAPAVQPEEAAPAAPAPAPQAAARPRLPSSMFMGTVLAAGDRGSLADFQRKVLEDSAAMAKRTNGRIRVVGGRSAEDRQGVVDELVRLGIPAGRIAAAADPGGARAAIDVLVEN
jgi:hypothetical protein